MSFLQGKLENLLDDLDDELKIITKKHFKDKFEFVNKKLENFPYYYVNPNNLNEIDLPEKKYFDNILTMKKITNKEYKNVKLFYKNMEFKNLNEYLECYLKSDITLLADIFNNFRKMIFDEFQLDPVKYISAPSLSKDCALKYSKCKIEHIKDVSIFQFVRKSIMGGLSDMIASHIELDDPKNETISYMDISSQYPDQIRRKLPYKDYKFVEEFDESKYGQNKDYGCILLCHVKTTDKIKNDHLFKQCPMLVSRIKITDNNLSEYQLNLIREKKKNKNKNFSNIIKYNSQSDKLIPNLGDDKNCYLNLEMHQMFKEAGYKIKINKILEYQHKEIFKDYIEYLYSKKKNYSIAKKNHLSLCIKF